MYTLIVIKKITQIQNLSDVSPKDDLDYWLGRSEEERLSAVEILRRQVYEHTPRLQRIARVIQQKSR